MNAETIAKLRERMKNDWAGPWTVDGQRYSAKTLLDEIERAQKEQDKSDMEWVRLSDQQQNMVADYDLRRRAAEERATAAEAERDRLGEIVNEADPEIMLGAIWELVGKPASHTETIGGKEYKVYDGLLSTLRVEMARLAAAEAERDRLREALEQYANPENWDSYGNVPEGDESGALYLWTVSLDGPAIARAALHPDKSED